MPRIVVEVCAVSLVGRSIRLLLSCLIAVGLSAGDMCACSASSTACLAAKGVNHAAKWCCCNTKPGAVCKCGMFCCQKQTPLRSTRVPQSNNGNSGAVKALAQSVIALACADDNAGLSSSGAPNPLASLVAPSTLQAQHIRLQI
jgi:hypothetical protein